MTLDEIRELIKLVTETGVAELEVQRGENRVRVRRVLRGYAAHNFSPPPDAVAEHPQLNQTAPPAVAAAAAAAPSPASASATAAAEPADPLSDPAVVTIKSPIVGTFYEAPSPGAPTFVRVGDNVKPGDVLCIIESMKLMNEIEAELAGTVVACFVNNAQPVEYGEALFAIRPV